MLIHNFLTFFIFISNRVVDPADKNFAMGIIATFMQIFGEKIILFKEKNSETIMLIVCL